MRRNHRKAVPSKVLYLRISEELHRELSAIADNENRSLTAVVEKILEDQLHFRKVAAQDPARARRIAQRARAR